mmetsp:Transcript_24573/g.58099  ORF Transcript_24573/g.58099 Transcript_24573/m.58099 type:complete len:351 (+) Transcript_24573:1595-2647(+)
MMDPSFDHTETGQIVQVFVGGNGSSVIKENQAVARHLVALGHGLEIQRFEPNIHSQETESQSQSSTRILHGIDALVDPLQVQHDRQCPSLGRNPGHEFARAGHTLEALFLRHGQGLLKGLGDFGNLPGIDVEGSTHHPCARSELTEDYKASATSPISLPHSRDEGLLVGNSELEGNEVEAVSDRRDEADVRCLHECHALLQSHSPVGGFLELDGSWPHGVDSLDLIRDLVAGFDVIVSTFPGRDSDLDQHDLTNPFGASLEESLDSQELEGNSFEALESFDGTEYGLPGIACPDHGGLPSHTVVLQNLVQDGRFDSGVNAGHGHVPSVGVDRKSVPTVSGCIGDHPIVQA